MELFLELMGWWTGLLFFHFFSTVKKLLKFWNFVNIKVAKSKLDHLGFYCKLDRTIRMCKKQKLTTSSISSSSSSVSRPLSLLICLIFSIQLSLCIQVISRNMHFLHLSSTGAFGFRGLSSSSALKNGILLLKFSQFAMLKLFLHCSVHCLFSRFTQDQNCIPKLYPQKYREVRNLSDFL